MQNRWLFTQFSDDGTGMRPVGADYAYKFLAPQHPDTADGWALIQVIADPQQIEAAAQDSRIIVCPLPFDPRPVNDRIIQEYQFMGATTGMSLALVLATLAEKEPIFGQVLTA